MSRRAIAPALLLALALARIALSDRFADREIEVPAPDLDGQSSARAREILRDLAPGDRLAGLEVDRVSGPAGGEICVEMRAGDGRGMRAWIGERGARGYDPAVRTERFDLFYGPPSPGAASVPDPTSVEVLRALAERIDPAGAPAPPPTP